MDCDGILSSELGLGGSGIRFAWDLFDPPCVWARTGVYNPSRAEPGIKPCRYFPNLIVIRTVDALIQILNPYKSRDPTAQTQREGINQVCQPQTRESMPE